MRLLVVEDSKVLASALAEGLQRRGFVVDVCEDGESALSMLAETTYVAMILDHGLPKMSGLDLCRTLRRVGKKLPILFLTARDTVDDRVAGLNAGADDYLVKPFAFEELVARVHALVRREAQHRGSELRVGDLAIDCVAGVVRYAEQVVMLSAKELKILIVLMRYPGRILSQIQIVEQAWTQQSDASPEVVRAHIKNLRRKLREETSREIVETVYGLGYRIAI